MWRHWWKPPLTIAMKTQTRKNSSANLPQTDASDNFDKGRNTKQLWIWTHLPCRPTPHHPTTHSSNEYAVDCENSFKLHRLPKISLLLHCSHLTMRHKKKLKMFLIASCLQSTRDEWMRVLKQINKRRWRGWRWVNMFLEAHEQTILPSSFHLQACWGTCVMSVYLRRSSWALST